MYIVLQDISTVADANQSYGIHIIDYSWNNDEKGTDLLNFVL